MQVSQCIARSSIEGRANAPVTTGSINENPINQGRQAHVECCAGAGRSEKLGNSLATTLRPDHSPSRGDVLAGASSENRQAGTADTLCDALVPRARMPNQRRPDLREVLVNPTRWLLVGLLATLSMDLGSSLLRITGLTAGLPPAYIGRWFAALARGGLSQRSILDASPLRGERPLALIGHYLIGTLLTVVFLALVHALPLNRTRRHNCCWHSATAFPRTCCLGCSCSRPWVLAGSGAAHLPSSCCFERASSITPYSAPGSASPATRSAY